MSAVVRRCALLGLRRAGGWSLVELAVVLAVMGLVGLALWRLLPLAPQVAADDLAARDLAQAEQALVGYALAHSRLPAAVVENGVAVLPVDALGLPGRLKLRYQVQAALTVSPGDSFSPLLPPITGTGPGVPTVTGEINGLDFCMSLRLVETRSLVGMENVPTAFALMHGGPVGHDRPAATTAFALPGSEGLGERRVLAAGPGEFASRLGCPERVAQMQGAARAAYTAYDLARIAAEYERLRIFAEQVAQMNLDNARVGEIFAGFDLAFGILVQSLAIAQEVAGWPPDAFGIAVGIVSHVTATAQIAIAIYNMTVAVADRQAAEADIAEALQQRLAAEANRQRMQALATFSLTHAQALDRRGLQP